MFLYSKIAFKKETPTPVKIITLYLGCYFLSELGMYLHSYYGIYNHYFSHFYFIPQFILLSLFYKSLFSKTQKKVVNTILILVLSIITIQYITNPSIWYQYNPLEILLTNCAILFYSILYLYNSLTNEGQYLYINAGILLYASLSTLIFFFFRFINFNELEINLSPLILLNKLLAVGYITLFIVEYKQNLWKTIKS